MVFEGHFTDGRTAQRHAVKVICADLQLQIFDQHNRVLRVWPLAGLRLVGSAYRWRPIRLTHRDHKEASLSFGNHEILTVLAQAQPYFRQRWTVEDHPTLHLFVWTSALVLVIAVLLRGVPLLAGPLAHLIPLHWEQAWGEQLLTLVGENVDMCSNAAGRAALQVLTKRLVATTEVPFPFRVQVSPTPLVNAIALPGGHIVLFQGLITAAQSPEEVAGVLAHEMAHEVQRHPMRGLIRTAGLRLVIGALSGGAGAAFSFGGVGEVLLDLSHNRQDEAEADRIGVEMLNKANIRSDGMIAFFTRQARKEEDESSTSVTKKTTTLRVVEFLSTHPTDEARIVAIKAQARGTGNALTKAQWQALRSICYTESKKS